jgi:hypothetical protein
MSMTLEAFRAAGRALARRNGLREPEGYDLLLRAGGDCLETDEQDRILVRNEKGEITHRLRFDMEEDEG